VIIDNLHFLRVTIPPHKTDPPPFIDANAVLSLAIAPQSFQPVPGRRRNVSQFRGAVQLAQFPLCCPLDWREPLTSLAAEETCSPLTAKRLDHEARL
jgi:hypothetical protein